MAIINKITCDGVDCPHSEPILDNDNPMSNAPGWIKDTVEHGPYSATTRDKQRALPPGTYYFCSTHCRTTHAEKASKA